MAINLSTVSISELGDKKFFIPHYQRGYRWTKRQVKQLLDDIDSFIPREIPGKAEKTFYCLQPVVVKLLDEDIKQKLTLEGEWYEVVDGQQRLTTIFLLLQYINQKWVGEEKIPKFSILYETRPGSSEFLNSLSITHDNTVVINKTNIDFYHMSDALQTIHNWRTKYEEKNKKALNTADFQSKLLGHSKIIWYQVSGDERSSQSLFERLNLGKIPLTNAELTKALFLSSESFKSFPGEERRVKQYEIARLWDEMEHKLNEKDLKFWSFITNNDRDKYETKIDLILDLIAGKKEESIDPLSTFLRFSRDQATKSLSAIWEEIEQFYFTLLEWYHDKKYYHKIGYLIAAHQFGSFKNVEIHELAKKSRIIPKDEFANLIDSLIVASVKFEISELRYKDHPNQIFNILLLFNVETNSTTDSISEFYPFSQHKGTFWSLEHIHARNSENFDKNKREPWLAWLNNHLPILQELLNHEKTEDAKQKITQLIRDIERYNNTHLTWERFDELFERVNDLLSIEKESLVKESEGLSNLALLSQPDNASLNNSVFEVKRREILRLDKKGSFIPICTRRVFMKYYNENTDDKQTFFWSSTDRKNYLKELTQKLSKYLTTNNIEDNEND